MKNAFATTALILACGLSATSSFAAYSAPQNSLNNVATSAFFAPSAPSVLSRSAVQAEALQAQKAGVPSTLGESATVRETSIPSSTTRAAVKADYLQSQKAGTLPAIGERS